MAVSGTDVQIRDSTFTENVAASGACVAIAGTSRSSVRIANSLFDLNALRRTPAKIRQGGSMLSTQGSGHSISIQACNISRNWAPYGVHGVRSVISLAAESRLVMSDSVFAQNWGARQSGDVLWTPRHSNAPLYLLSATANLSNVIFAQNNAGGDSKDIFDLAHNTFERWCSLSAKQQALTYPVANASLVCRSSSPWAYFKSFSPDWQRANGGAISLDSVSCTGTWGFQLRMGGRAQAWIAMGVHSLVIWQIQEVQY